MTGKKHTAETIAKMSKTRTGRKHTAETIAKIAIRREMGMTANNIL